MLRNLRLIHEAGYVYNGLRLENIFIDHGPVKLIDFGNSVEYMDCQGTHFKNYRQSKFKGNIILSSHNVLI